MNTYSFLILVFLPALSFVAGIILMTAAKTGDINGSIKSAIGFFGQYLFIAHSYLRNRTSTDGFLTAYRSAYIVEFRGILVFKPLRELYPMFRTDDVAVCATSTGRSRQRLGLPPLHQPPGDNCQCGFYSLKSAGYLGWILGSRANGSRGELYQLVTLQVDLSGKVIEGRLGYRAERQQVLKVIVPARCGMCKTFYGVSEMPPWKRRRHTIGAIMIDDTMTPVCSICASSFPGVMPLSDIASMLGTEVVLKGSRLVR